MYRFSEKLESVLITCYEFIQYILCRPGNLFDIGTRAHANAAVTLVSLQGMGVMHSCSTNNSLAQAAIRYECNEYETRNTAHLEKDSI